LSTTRAENKSTAIFRDRNTKAARQIPRDLWRIVQRKLKMLDVAARVDDLGSPPGNRLKVLKGQMKGPTQHSRERTISRHVSMGERASFEVAVEDYH
jgi:plasmid maintenance system killer protein